MPGGRELDLGQIIRTGTLVAPVFAALWALAAWTQSLPTARSLEQVQQIQASLQQQLAQGTEAIAQLRTVVTEQQKTLGKVVDFMDEQTMKRRNLGAEERLRRELCRAGDLKPERCQALPTDAEVEAMLR